MKDINFFSVYDKRKNGTGARMFRAGLILVLVLAVVAGSYVGLTIYNAALRLKTAEIDAYLQSDEVVETLRAVERYNRNQVLMEQYSLLVDEVLANLKAGDHLNATRMDAISKALPSSVTLSTLSVMGGEVNFSFQVSNVAVASDLVYALSELDFFETVKFMGAYKAVATATGAPVSGYTVEISAVLKGGASE